MFRLHASGSRLSRLAPRILGALAVALLLALGSSLSSVHRAFASGGDAVGYVATATSANTFGDYTLLDNQITNNNPNAIVFVTANWNPGGTYTGFDNHQVGVWYDSWAGKWGIFNEDGTSMPIGASFNVNAQIGSAGDIITTQTATTANTSGYIMFLNDSLLNNNPSANFDVTQNWNPGGGRGVYNNHAIGVWYDSRAGEWTIYNEDFSPIPSGASFNISVDSSPIFTVTQVATSSNTSGDSTCINLARINGNPNALVFVTHVYSGYFTDVAAVWYDGYLGQWCVFDGSYKNMPTGATFFVVDGN